MANSFVYYLKYRPQTLNELIGQEIVKKTLLSSFNNNKLSHAYLFVGPRGTGKTSTARILAKMVNCEKLNEIPCNKCPACISITDGSNLDLIEIDAASNRGIEDIRSLRDKIKLAPTSARKKVYIIDEVHMLTTEAFNALLKTLEEPPAHALFILATTESNKIPQTILSRVQRLDFKLASPEQLLEVLKRIVSKEKIDIDEEALKILIKKSDGSFRDGVKLLDQIASLGEKITAPLTAEHLKSARFENILDLIQSLSAKDTAKTLLNVSKQIEQGVDIKELILTLMDALRSLVLVKSGVGEQLVKAYLTEDKYQSLVAISKDFGNADLINNLKLLQDALEKLKFAGVFSLPLELAVVEMCDASTKLEEDPEGPERQFKNIQKDSEDQNFRRPADQTTGNPETLIIQSSDAPAHSESFRTDFTENENTQGAANDSSPEIAKLKEKWNFVLETIRSVNFSLEALLRSGNITKCTQTTVVIEVPYAFHQRILEAPKNRDLLEGIFSDVLGRNMKISTILGVRPLKVAEIANIEVAKDDEIIRAAAEIFNSDTVN